MHIFERERCDCDVNARGVAIKTYAYALSFSLADHYFLHDISVNILQSQWIERGSADRSICCRCRCRAWSAAGGLEERRRTKEMKMTMTTSSLFDWSVTIQRYGFRTKFPPYLGCLSVEHTITVPTVPIRPTPSTIKHQQTTMTMIAVAPGGSIQNNNGMSDRETEASTAAPLPSIENNVISNYSEYCNINIT